MIYYEKSGKNTSKLLHLEHQENNARESHQQISFYYAFDATFSGGRVVFQNRCIEF